MMEAERSNFFKCHDCFKVFSKRMHYNRHRKSHDRPYPCQLCTKAFGLKADLERHKLTHGRMEARFRCNYPECGFRGTNRKDYLWKHMVDKHQFENEELSADKIIRMHYEDAIREAKQPANEIRDDFELLEAARAGDDNKIEELLLRSSNTLDGTTKVQGRTSLHLAARGGYDALARMLLENGADMQQKSSSGETAFFMAIKAGHTAVVKIFLENGASVYEKSNRSSGLTPLTMALRHRHKDVMKLLIEHESVPEKIIPSFDALISAIEGNQEDNVVLLLESGVDVNQKPPTGASEVCTALHAAVAAGPSMTKLILEAHGDLEATFWNWTPLMYSLLSFFNMNVEVVRLLVEAGAVISPEIWESFTPELREQYADRCPVQSLDRIEAPFEEMLTIDENFSTKEELNLDDILDFVEYEGEQGT